MTNKNDAMRQPTTSTVVSDFGVATNDSGIARTLPAVKVPCPSRPTDDDDEKHVSSLNTPATIKGHDATVPWLGGNIQVLNGRCH